MAPTEHRASSVVAGSPPQGEQELEEEPEPIDEENAWRSQYTTAADDDWAAGYDEV